MAKLLIILAVGGAIAHSVVRAHEQPPLLIDSQAAPATALAPAS